ncbi:MAG TPA: glycosyltransferase, partial [Bacteroidaceae bacterium]|nr:glycosyltransferase [Bacteroidaceae bacterium]
YDLQYRFSSDFDWCIRMMRAVEKNDGRMVLVPGVLIDYLDEGVTTQNHRASLQERFWIMTKHYGLPITIGKHLSFIWKKLLK